MHPKILAVSGLSGILAVALGAFGSHSLREVLTAEQLHTFQTGVSYQFYHTLALMALSVSAYHFPSRWLIAAAWLLAMGIVLFSGSLYLLSILDSAKWLGPVTPVGGLCFVAGWVCVAVGGFAASRHAVP